MTDDRERPAGRALRWAAALLAALPAAGCAWTEQRALDFADMFRFEGRAGYGLRAQVGAGELLHAGVGSSRSWGWGLVYGRAESEPSTEDHFPLSVLWTIVDRTQEAVHSLPVGENGKTGTHRCFIVFPGSIGSSSAVKTDIHYFDLEAGFLALCVGLELGFSLGELADWLLGLFKFDDSWGFLDLAGDDRSADREVKRVWVPRFEKEPLLQPR
jgi:hypothetical protein